MSTSDESQEEPAQGVQVGDLGEDEPVLRKHCNQLLHEQKAVAQTVQGFTIDLKAVQNRLNKLEGKKAKGQATEARSTKAPLKKAAPGSSQTVKRKILTTSATTTKKGGAKKTSDPLEAVNPRKRRADGGGQQSIAKHKKTTPAVPEAVFEEELVVAADNDDYVPDSLDESEKDTEDDKYEDEGDQEENEEDDDDEDTTVVFPKLTSVDEGGMPVPDMNETVGHEVNGKTFRTVLNGSGVFLHYTSPSKFVLPPAILKELIGASFREIDCTDVQEAIRKCAVSRLISVFAVKVLKQEIGNQKPPVYLMKEIRQHDVFDKDQDTVSDVIDAQPQPIQNAVRVLVQRMSLEQVMSSADLREEVLDAFKAINEEVVTLRGGLQKLTSPRKMK